MASLASVFYDNPGLTNVLGVDFKTEIVRKPIMYIYIYVCVSVCVFVVVSPPPFDNRYWQVYVPILISLLNKD